MAPRTSASNLGSSFARQEKDEEQEQGHGRAKTKAQVDLFNFKLPLVVTKRSRASSGAVGEEEGGAKRIRIQDDGRELTVNCDIGRPRCSLLLASYSLLSPPYSLRSTTCSLLMCNFQV